MTQLFILVLLAFVSPSLAQYDQIWSDILAGDNPPITRTMIALFFRGMMNPQPGPTDPTLVSRNEFKAFWSTRYGDSEKVRDGLFSFFDHHKDEYIDAQDVPPMMNVADTDENYYINAQDIPPVLNVADADVNGVLDRMEFNAYIRSAYEYAEQQRLSPGNSAHGHNHAHNGHQQHHGKPFFG